ncbi:MAG: hypothetical protein COT91_05475 [Candidatus Doudnabacteria bacterium CG10_big_fil_rev_8_21_14_0_10_41_10]|uniref:Mannosyl-glycoprotein endo-beta-N-acetylglucosamidase-like domain-containing protein n=1 Tax=Candidatus Doudnabacteria bacterium CG10_big_fil_rev_8_21_14_0_10_41_10 TaxID=1974551 RepID=A0A2H0VC81_9BACT|nr:MAG: hypothetical protein COT91_05475 [Candidatus Doudnabacteria bacterium CG10_big_fil_rev_8_21_14_0_10_41_10]
MLALIIWALSDKENKLSLSEQMLASIALSAMLLWVFPNAALAQSVQTTPQLAFEIKHQNYQESPQPVFPRDIPGNKLFTLKNYLASKNSPLVDHVEILLLQRNWKIVLAISQAESNMCKREIGHNCWGIGGGNHRKYPSYAEAIVDANDVVQRYLNRGHTGTKSMMLYYVGWDNQSWVVATQNILYQLNQIGI